MEKFGYIRVGWRKFSCITFGGENMAGEKLPVEWFVRKNPAA